MAKVTTIIDIGSNSMRMVVLEKSSRFAFNLINETKSRVKISEGCYENNGNLQEVPMQRAYESLISFLNISKALKSRKIICVATSALRDAPNSKIFLSKVQKNLGLNIKIINGETEAYYGGVAALNLIHDEDFVTIDIGGGSTEFSFIKDGKIEKSISLDIGTVRMKELYFNKNDTSGAKEYILKKLRKIFDLNVEIPDIAVGIGGSIRALSRAVMQKNDYPLDVLHGFKYKLKDETNFLTSILACEKPDDLKTLGIKKDRFDTIKEGTFIFKTILEELHIEKVITSGVGVREGVYLTDLLRNNNAKFPSNYNISVRSLLDRFQIDKKQSTYYGNNARKLFEVLKPIHNLDEKYREILIIASKLHSIGIMLDFYKSKDSAFDFINDGLNYGFTHSDRLLIAFTIKYSKKSLPSKKDLVTYEELLPKIEVVKWLSYMITLNLNINHDLSRPACEYSIENKILNMKLENNSFMTRQNIEKIEKPKGLEIIIK